MRGTYQKTGASNTRLYKIWIGMLRRCNNPNDDSYFRYGGRGITVCSEWSDFMTFKKWAMSNGYSDTLTIERINNNGNYEPTNCKWASMLVQSNNTRRNVYLDHDGKHLSIAQWARELGVSRQMLWIRYKRGWSTEDILNVPKQVHHFIKN